jgi:hypothetical protein
MGRRPVLLVMGWAFLLGTLLVAVAAPAFEYAGSSSCAACHQEIFKAWKKTPHARMTRTPQEIPYLNAIPDAGFEGLRGQLKFVLGSHYVHRFVAEASGTLVVLPGIFDLHERQWLKARDFGWQKRYYLKQCAGCHTTGYTVPEETFIEIGVGCESCHGPGLTHVRTLSPEFIVNPAKLAPERREMLCESCHTSGVDTTGGYCFPVGYRPGEDLTPFFFGLTPKPGQTPDTFAGDETYNDRRRQWEFLQARLFLAKGLTCDYCQNFRNYKTENNSDYLTHSEYCLTCHRDRQDHPTENPGKNCVSCHAPMRTRDGKSFSIHDHKFCFQTPELTAPTGPPSTASESRPVNDPSPNPNHPGE